MNEIYIELKRGFYYWTLRSKNGKNLARSFPYRTKFHCNIAAIKLFPKLQLTDKVRDRRERA